MKQVIESYELLDSATVDGAAVLSLLRDRGLRDVSMRRVNGDTGYTDFLRVVVPGSGGRSSGGAAPTTGIVGKLGGIGARPERIGLVSDADGAIVAVACALKLADMAAREDRLPGDVVITTHICPFSPTRPHNPVPFMGSLVTQRVALEHEVDARMEAILSIDATKGNRILNYRGVAISPTVKEGYVLRVSEDLLDLLCNVTGDAPHVLPITTQDITPYGNGLYHLNSIMQPCTVTSSPVVGLAITSAVAVPGCATGANNVADLELAARFSIEVAKEFGAGRCSFFDEEEWGLLQRTYGPLGRLQAKGC